MPPLSLDPRPRRRSPAFVLGLPTGLLMGLLMGGACQNASLRVDEPDIAQSRTPGMSSENSSASNSSPAIGVAELPDPPQRAKIRPAPQAVHSFADAKQAIRSGNHEGAIEYLLKDITSNGPHQKGTPEVILALADAYLMIGKLQEADQRLQGLASRLQGSLESIPCLRKRAKIARIGGDDELAITLLDQALVIHPDDLPTIGARIDVGVAQGKGKDPVIKALVDQVYDAYDQGNAKTAGDLLAVASATLSNGSSGGYHDANMVLSEAQELAPPQEGGALADEIALRLASIFFEKYNYRDASEVVGEVLARDPWQPYALAMAAQIALAKLELAHAEELASYALQTNPKLARAHAALAEIDLIEGHRKQARSRVETSVLTRNPRNTNGLSIMAILALVDRNSSAYEHWRERALSFNKNNARFFTYASDLLTHMHLYPEANAIIKDAIARNPQDPGIQSAWALDRLRFGDEAKGREALELAWKGDRFNERTFNLRKLYQERIDPDYLEIQDKDLTLRLPKKDASLVRDQLIAAIRRAKAALDRRYGLLNQNIRIEVYESFEEFSIRTIGVPNLGAVGVCFGPVITMVGPYPGTHNFETIVWHELAHVYALKLSKGRVPRWFTEGLSEWESELADPTWARASAKLLSQALASNKIRKLSELELAFLRADGAKGMEIAYATASYALRYLGEKYGTKKILAVLRGYGEGHRSSRLFEQHFGDQMPVIESEFATWMGKQLQQQLRGWIPPHQGATKDKRAHLYLNAKQAIANKEWKRAEQHLQALLHTDGDGVASRTLYGQLYWAQKKHKQAIAEFEKASRWSPQAIEPLAYMARIAQQRQQPQLEIDYLQRILNMDAMTYEPAARLALLAMILNDSKAQRLAHSRTQAIAPLHPGSLAIAAYQEASTKSASSTAMAQATTQLQRAQIALQNEGQFPSDTWALATLAAAKLQQPELARELAKGAVKANGQNRELDPLVRKALQPWL